MSQTTKKPYLQIALFVITGLLLAWFTIEVLQLFREGGSSQTATLIFIVNPGVGISYLAVMLGVFALDLFWLLFFILWAVRRKLHIRKEGRALHLP